MNNNDTQMNMFDCLFENYKITKPIRLIEFFAGYGSQALALKYLGVKFEYYKISEWAINSIQAYKDLHFEDYCFNWSCELSDDEVLDELTKTYVVSKDYNTPATREQLKKMNFRKIYNNIITTHNLGSICNVHSIDLAINDLDKFTYLLTYSFPCQDLSLAGKKKGMKDTSTRSGLLWEVERILKECKASGKLPQVLLMENVPEVIGVNNVSDFAKWRHTLEELGYSNYVECLNGVNYGIPQSRNRCFMISILGEYNYTFPKPIKLEKHLTDLLEKNVDSKYYLTSNQIESIKQWNAQQKPLEQLERTSKSNISPTLTTRTSAYAASMILAKDNLKSKLCNELIEKEHLKVGDVIKHSYAGQILDGKKKPIERRDNIMVTLTTRADCLGVVYLDENGLGIRKLTPKECFRLMGVKDEDFEKIKENQSEMSLYHLVGDSIIVNVLCAIFKQLF